MYPPTTPANIPKAITATPPKTGTTTTATLTPTAARRYGIDKNQSVGNEYLCMGVLLYLTCDNFLAYW